MVPKNPSIPSWKFAAGNIQHNFLCLSDVTPWISHRRADVRLGGRQGQRHRNLRETFQLSLFVVNVDCNKYTRVYTRSAKLNEDQSGDAEKLREDIERFYNDAS